MARRRRPNPAVSWPPEGAATDHGLTEAVDLFIDESGPRADGTLSLGVVAVEVSYEPASRLAFDHVASRVERDHPALLSPAYEGEWKGRQLARQAVGANQRKEIRGGVLLSDTARQAVYARGLNIVRTTPGCRAFALTYEWTGGVKGPDDQDGYRIRRAIKLALTALTFQRVAIRYAHIDDGHSTHYSVGINEFAVETSTTPIPHGFVDSKSDRRIQVADLIAFAAHIARFPGGKNTFPTAHGWLDGFSGPRLIRAGSDPDHYRIEP